MRKVYLVKKDQNMTNKNRDMVSFWNFEFFKDAKYGWREVKNYDIKSSIVGIMTKNNVSEFAVFESNSGNIEDLKIVSFI